MVGWGRSAHTPVSNPSPRLCKEAQKIHQFPRVNSGRTVPQYVIGTFGGAVNVALFSPRKEFGKRRVFAESINYGQLHPMGWDPGLNQMDKRRSELSTDLHGSAS